MGDFVLFAFLPSGQKLFAGVFFEFDGTCFAMDEIGVGDLFAVDESEGAAVGDDGAKFFHEVEGERGATRAVPVKKAALGVESDAFEGRPAIVGEKAIGEGNEGVDGIGGRSAHAPGKFEAGCLDEFGKNFEIAGCGIAFDSADGFGIRRRKDGFCGVF